VHICTGSPQEAAEKYALLLGISKDNIRYNTVAVITKPGEVSKTSYIQQLQDEGRKKVAMIGDGVNDITAIEAADVGISVQSNIGARITQQHAGIVIQKGLLFPIANAFDVAQKTKDNIYQNLFVSLTYNSAITLVAAGLFVALGFILNPAVGVALVVLESTIVLSNLYRFKRQEIMSAATNENNAVTESSENATSRILDALGYHAQPKKNLAVAHESQAENNTPRILFAPAKQAERSVVACNQEFSQPSSIAT
jgi:Cu2+-exporting ATPase